MTKKIILAGLLGGVVFMVWTFIVNGIFGFKNSLDMKKLANESRVYELLKENITEPGRYSVNPQITNEGFPQGEPAFAILYGGMGHEAAAWLMTVKTPLFFLIPLLAAWLLSLASPAVLSSYPKKVLFVLGLGVLLALFHDLRNWGIADYPLQDALAYALHNILLWLTMGLVLSWIIKPRA